VGEARLFLKENMEVEVLFWNSKPINIDLPSFVELLVAAIAVGVAGGLSAVLTNDVVVVAMTPVLVSITLARGLNPVPFLLAFCFAANVGSAATIIGSPQNMIAAEVLHLSFVGFMRVSALPALLGLPLVWAVIVLFYRGNWARAAKPAAAGQTPAGVAFNRRETLKAGVVTIALVAAFVLSDWPHMLVAMAGAAVLLVNRSIASKDMLKHVDGDLLLLLIGLFTRPVAFVLSGLMAFAYFIAHAPKDFWPLLNGGELAATWSFVFLYFVFAGGGAWSVDRLRAKGQA